MLRNCSKDLQTTRRKGNCDLWVAHTGEGRLKALLAGLLGLCGIVCSGAQAQDASPFKILKLEGNQVRWPQPRDGSRLVVTYRIATQQAEFPGARNCRKLSGIDDLVAASNLSTVDFAEELAAAFSMWEQVANITFREADEGTRTDILVGAQMEPEGWAFAEVFYDTGSRETIKPISRALVCLNPVRRWKVGFDGDLKTYDLRYTLAHEIGHAIGLDHPQGGNQIMGYRYEEQFRTLQAGDVRGAVLLYGEPAPASQVAQTEVESSPIVARSSLGRFAKRWGTRGFTARSP